MDCSMIGLVVSAASTYLLPHPQVEHEVGFLMLHDLQPEGGTQI